MGIYLECPPGNQKLALARYVGYRLYLIGDGAMNHPRESYQVVVDGGFEEAKKVTLAPGETCLVPIKSLDCGHCERSYWLLPGDYTLHARATVCVISASDELTFADLRVPPLRVKVVAEKK